MKTPIKTMNTPQELIEDIRSGKMVLLVDDEDRENEGDLVLASDFVTTSAINFMALEARGLICLALSAEQIQRLQIPMMVRDELNLSPNKTAFTVSIEAASGVSTGISAQDRAHTVKVAAHPAAKPSDVHSPGHIFPIKAQPGGVLRRAGHTEGSVDLARLAGLNPAAVICEVMNPDGSMARVKELQEFARKHNLKIGTIVDLIEFRLQQEVLIEEIYQHSVTDQIQLHIFKSKVDGIEHLAFSKGPINSTRNTLVRMYVENTPKELIDLFSTEQLPGASAIEMIKHADQGVFVLIRSSDAKISLKNKLQKKLEFPYEASYDQRDYGIGAQILRALGVGPIELISHRIDKKIGLKGFNLEIIGHRPLVGPTTHVVN